MACPRALGATPGTPRSAPFLRAFACAAVVSLLSLSSCGESTEPPAPDDFRVSLSVGIGGTWRPDRWTELRFDVRNDADDFDGEVTVRAFRADRTRDPVIYRSRLDVPRGGRRRLSLPVFAGDWDALVVDLRSPSFERRSRFDLAAKRGDFSNTADILVIGERLSHIGVVADGLENHLNALREEIHSRRAVRKTRPFPPEVDSSVTFVASGELPSHPAAYDPFRLVLLYESSLASASDEELEALARWVERGGALVAFPGAEWSAGLPGGLATLLGVEAVEADRVMPPDVSRRLGPAVSQGIYRRIVPASGAAVVGGGLAVSHRPGTGFARTFSFTPEPAAFADAKSAVPLDDWLEEAYAHVATFSGNVAGALRGADESLAAALLAMTGFQFPSFGAIFLALVVYLAGGFFLPAWIFKKLGRREWTFAAIALAACLATWGIYRWGLISGVPAGELEEISIVRPYRTGGGAEVTSFVACISPSYRRVELSVPEEVRASGSASLARPVRPVLHGGISDGETAARRVATELRVAGDGSLEPAPFPLYPSSPVFFRFDYALEAKPFVDVARRETAQGNVLAIENLGRSGLRTLYVTGDAASAGDEIPPGGAREVRWPEPRDSRWGSPAEALGSGPDVLDRWHPRRGRWGVLAVGAVFERAAWSVVGPPESSYGGSFSELSEFYRVPMRDEPRALLLWSAEPTFPGGGFPRRKALSIAVLELEPLDIREDER